MTKKRTKRRTRAFDILRTTPRQANANFFAAAPASPPEGSNLKKAPRCAPWRVVTADAVSGFSDDKVAFETLGASEDASEKKVFVTFESPARAAATLRHLRAAETAGKPYRAVFFVRDPRDVVTQAYLDRVGRRRTLDQSLDDDVLDDDLIDREIDAFTAAATAANLGLVAELGNVSGRSSRPPSIRKPTSTRRARSRRACVSSRRARRKRALRALRGPARRIARGLRTSRAVVRAKRTRRRRRLRRRLRPRADRLGGGRAPAGAVPPGAWRSHFTARNARASTAHGALLRALGYPDSGTDALESAR